MTDSPSTATGSRVRRVAALASALLLTVAWLLFVAPSARAACPITDPVCLVDEVADGVTDDVQDVVDDVTEVTDPIVDDVEEIVDPVVDEVEEVLPIVEDVEDIVDDVVDDVEDIVEDTTGIDIDPPTVGDDDPVQEGGTPVEGGPGPTDPTEPRTPPDSENPGGPGASDDPTGGSKTEGAPGTDGGAGGILASVTSVGTVIDAESASATLAMKAPAFFDRIGGIAGIATLLAFPFVLALVVGSFVLVQNRIDRRDPRLALAPVRPDDLRFE